MKKLFDSYIGSSAKVARTMIEANVKGLLAEKNVDRASTLLNTAKKKVLIDILAELKPNFTWTDERKTKSVIQKEIWEIIHERKNKKTVH